MRALGLLSSGLDSALALKLVQMQGLEIIAVNFVLPFASEREDYAGNLARSLEIPLIRAEARREYIEIIRNPKYGYGRNLNPCIDCRIYMLREAKRITREVDANFIVTGDVLGERPKSQHESALRLEEKESALKGMILRPLSAQLLPQTVPEQKGWVDRNQLLSLKGRSRKPQLALAKEFGIKGYRSPSSGCLLTNKEFALKLRKLFSHKERVSKRDIELLRIGRHFYLPSSSIMVGRNKKENQRLLDLKGDEDFIFEVPDYPSPITILEGSKSKEAAEFAAQLTAKYSDANADQVSVACRKGDKGERIIIETVNARVLIGDTELAIS